MPYEGKDSCELVVAVICNMLPRPSLSEEERRGWPPEIIQMMTDCMFEDPAKRPDFAQMLDIFEKIEPKKKPERRQTLQNLMHGHSTFVSSPRLDVVSAAPSSTGLHSAGCQPGYSSLSMQSQDSTAGKASEITSADHVGLELAPGATKPPSPREPPPRGATLPLSRPTAAGSSPGRGGLRSPKSPARPASSDRKQKQMVRRPHLDPLALALALALALTLLLTLTLTRPCGRTSTRRA